MGIRNNLFISGAYFKKKVNKMKKRIIIKNYINHIFLKDKDKMKNMIQVKDWVIRMNYIEIILDGVDRDISVSFGCCVSVSVDYGSSLSVGCGSPMSVDLDLSASVVCGLSVSKVCRSSISEGKKKIFVGTRKEEGERCNLYYYYFQIPQMHLGALVTRIFRRYDRDCPLDAFGELWSNNNNKE